MNQNDHEIWLLKNKPGELISNYQGLIRGIVHNYRKYGYVAARDANDLIQEINKYLLEKIVKIQDQYNGRSSLKTYFSVIVRNICREKFRKISVLEEPRAPDYYKLEKSHLQVDNLLIDQEYERFEKVISLMFKDGMRFLLIFRFVNGLKVSRNHFFNLNKKIRESDLDEAVSLLNGVDEGATKKTRFELLSKVLGMAGGGSTSPDSIRKWYESRGKECLNMMNGNPPRSAYTIETLQILVEKYEILKIVN
jgi:RNA polymerase sigma factor (sigma-70 family)